MAANKKPGLREQDRAAIKNHNETVARNKRTVNWLKDFFARSGMKLNDAVDILRSAYPGMDKPLLSKAENPKKYGITLTTEAKSLLKTKGEDHDQAAK